MLEDVSLEAFAAVRAGVAEGFALSEVLEVEGLAAPVWDAAEGAWTRRLVEEPAELERYVGALAAAEDRLHRTVSPLEDDAEAWVAFSAQAARAPAATLEQSRLRLPDLSRLSRRWRAREASDPALAERLGALRAEVERSPRGAPEVRVEPARLRPSSAAPGVPDVERVDAAEPGPRLPLDRYAALVAELGAARDRDAVLARFALDAEAGEAEDQAWSAAFARDRGLRLDFGRLLALQRARVAARAEAPAPAAASRPTPPETPRAILVQEPRAATQDGLAPRGVTLPFRVAVRAPKAPPQGPAVTAEAAAPRGPTLPFAAPAPPPARPARGSTVEAIARRRATMPFGPARGGTAALGEGVRPAPALPFREPASAAITVERWASLVVELRLWPDRRAATLARYGLGEARRAELEAEISARAAREPAFAQALQRACEAYLAWLLSGRP